MVHPIESCQSAQVDKMARNNKLIRKPVDEIAQKMES
jgi:hypothetical protein